MTELQKLAVIVRKLTIALNGFSGELKAYNENIEKNTKVLQELKAFFEGNPQEYKVNLDGKAVDDLIESVPPPEEEERYGE